MNRNLSPPARLAGVALLLLGSGALQAEVRFLGHGHTDLAPAYRAADSTWNFHVGSNATGAEFAPDEVILKVRSGAQTTVPADARFGFLGTAGAAVWILPQVQDENLLHLGYGAEDVPDGVFVGNQVKVTLKSVTGPGDFFSYRVDGFGNPEVLFNSRDGVSASDLATVQQGGDAHLNWAFSQPGDYTVVLEATGVLSNGNQPTSSGPVAFEFSVGAGPNILDTGHTDLAIDYNAEADAWDVHVGSDALEEAYDADDVVLQVNGGAKTVVPGDPKFAFLGNAGDPLWILPQVQNEKLLFLGFGAEGISEGVFVGNQIKVSLKSVDGPGDFFSYLVDGFGTPAVLFNTRDGITDADVVTVQSAGDAHLNWAFTRPGDYSVVVEAAGILVNGNQAVSSGLVTYHFRVLKPVTFLTNEHVDLRALYDPSGAGSLSLVARDEDHHVNYGTNECILVANESAKLPLPDGTPFGNAGDPIYVLPSGQDPDLLYLGISAEGISPGVFGDHLELRLKSVSGPGQFFLWQYSQPVGYDVKMDTSDGISSDDKTTPLIGSHEHYNWGFTAPGVYHLTIQVSGRRIGDSEDLVSLDSPFTFHALPLPAEPATLSVVSVAANGDLQVEITGSTGTTYDVETSADFSRWNSLKSVTLMASTATISVPAAGPQLFVRAVAR